MHPLRQTVERKSLKSSQKNPLIFNLLNKKKKKTTTTMQILYEDSVILLNLNTQSLSEAHHATVTYPLNGIHNDTSRSRSSQMTWDLKTQRQNQGVTLGTVILPTPWPSLPWCLFSQWLRNTLNSKVDAAECQISEPRQAENQDLNKSSAYREELFVSCIC